MPNLTFEKAHALAQKLTTIDGCPRLDGAIEAMADDLIEICRSLEEAGRLIHEARFTWKKWQGTAALIELLQELRRPSATAWRAEFPALGPKPIPECSLCSDFGWLNRNGMYQWCTSQQARISREEDPSLIDDMNAKRVGPVLQQPVPINRKPIDKKDLERAFRERQNRTEQLIRKARATLDNAEASHDQREIARETLRSFGVKEEAC